MGHEVRRAPDEPRRIESVSYRWDFAGRRNRLFVSVDSDPRPLAAGSHEEPASAFLVEGSEVAVSRGVRVAH
jgi:hypothetical protein